MVKQQAWKLGKRIAPPRFVLFAAVLIVAGALGCTLADWLHGVMIGFDVAALVFLISCLPLLGDCNAKEMRRDAAENDAHRAGLLAITVGVTFVVLATVGAELLHSQTRDAAGISLIVATLVLAWWYSNVVYALHYAHLYYLPGPGGRDRGGIDIPDTKEPDYWDFLYFSLTLGMTFQTSDTDIVGGHYRRVAIFHSFAGFVFSIGVLAFTINILGGG